MGSLTNLILAFFLGLPCVYVLRALHLREVDHHEGPFKDTKRLVSFASEHVQQVCLWDWVRRLFGAYRIDGFTWHVKETSEVWTCTFCLSFWVAFLFSIPFFPESFWSVSFIAFHLTIATSAQVVYRIIYES